METYLSGHGAYRTEYHIVWIPKYRRRIINPGVKGYIVKLFPKIYRCYSLNLFYYITDCIFWWYYHYHVYMVFHYVIFYYPGSRHCFYNLRKKFDWLKKVYWKEGVVWSPGYFVSTIGIDEKVIIKYVRWQQSQDLGQAKLEF